MTLIGCISVNFWPLKVLNLFACLLIGKITLGIFVIFSRKEAVSQLIQVNPEALDLHSSELERHVFGFFVFFFLIYLLLLEALVPALNETGVNMLFCQCSVFHYYLKNETAVFESIWGNTIVIFICIKAISSHCWIIFKKILFTASIFHVLQNSRYSS